MKSTYSVTPIPLQHNVSSLRHLPPNCILPCTHIHDSGPFDIDFAEESPYCTLTNIAQCQLDTYFDNKPLQHCVIITATEQGAVLEPTYDPHRNLVCKYALPNACVMVVTDTGLPSKVTGHLLVQLYQSPPQSHTTWPLETVTYNSTFISNILNNIFA